MKGQNIVSIKEVAELAAVHRTTASRVLNNDSTVRVKGETRTRILRVAKRLGFDKNNSFESPSVIKTFGFLSPMGLSRNDNPFFSGVFDGVLTGAEANGLNVYVMNNIRGLSFSNLLEQKDFLGVISVGASPALLAPFEVANKPFVGIESPQHLRSSVLYSVRTDSFKATYNATKYLISQGHKNIFYLGYTVNGVEDISSLERWEGVACALKENGLYFGQRPISSALSETKNASGLKSGDTIGYDAMLQLIKANVPRPFACVCYADTHVEGAYHAAQENGLKIPDDVSFIGYDDLDFASHMVPSLTTISVPRFELGQKAVEVLLQCHEDVSLHDFVLPTKLITRESVLELSE